MASKKNLGMRIELSVDATKLKEGLDQTQEELKKQQGELTKTNKLMRFETDPIKAYNAQIQQINNVLPLLNTNIQKQRNFVQQLNKDYEKETDPKKRQALSKEIKNQTNLLKNLEDRYEYLGKEVEYTQKKVEDYGKAHQEAMEKAAEATKKAMDEAREEKINKISSGLNKLSGAVVAGITAIYAAGSKAADAIQDVNEKANDAGLSVENYQRMAYAMEQVGVSADTAGQVMKKTNADIGKVASGTGQDVVRVLNRLGISWQEFEKMDTETAFNTLIDALGNVTDKGELLDDLTKLFGDDLATRMLPLVEAGSKTLTEYGKQAKTIGDGQVDAAKKTKALKNELSATAMTLGAKLLPVVNKVLQKITDLSNKLTPYVDKMIDRLDRMSPAGQKIIAIVTGLTAAAGPLFTIGAKIAKLFGEKGILTKGLAVLAAHPIIGVIALVIGLLTAMYEKNEKFRESVNGLITGILEPLGSIVRNLMDVIQPLVDLVVERLNERLQLTAEILSPLIDLLTSILKPVLDAIAEVIGFLSDLLQPLIEHITNVTKKVTALTSGIFGSGSLQEAFQKLGYFLKDVFGPVIEWLSGLWEKMIGWVGKAREAVSGFMDKAKDWFGDRVNDAGNFFESMGNWFSGKGWNTNEQLADANTASLVSMSGGGTTNNSSNTYNNNSYDVTINTTADHMSIDELNDRMGYAY